MTERTSIFAGDVATRSIITTYAGTFASPPSERLLVDNIEQHRGDDRIEPQVLREHLEYGRMLATCLCYRSVADPHGPITRGEMRPRIEHEGHIAGVTQFGREASEIGAWPQIANLNDLYGMKIAQAIPGFHVSLNMGHQAFANPDAYMRKILRLTENHRVDPRNVTLEIIETIEGISRKMADLLHRLIANGFRIAIDDFPDGHAMENLLSAKKYKVRPDVLKISGSETASVGMNNDETIRNSIFMASDMGVSTFVFEGNADHPITRRQLDGLNMIQNRVGHDMKLYVEGPVFETA